MTPLPTDWLNKLFELMENFYQDRWANIVKNDNDSSLRRAIWNNSLNNLSYEQVKNGLKKCKDLSRVKFSIPPNNIQFYHWCIGIEYKKIEKKLYSYVPRRTSME
jgi:hypothetical protein